MPRLKPWSDATFEREAAVCGEAFNFASSNPMSALDVTRRVLDACGRPDLDPNILACAGHEIQDQFLDSSKAQSVLEWAPRYGFDEGLARTIAWYRDQPRLAATAATV